MWLGTGAAKNWVIKAPWMDATLDRHPYTGRIRH